jgi:hypothetical protein
MERLGSDAICGRDAAEVRYRFQDYNFGRASGIVVGREAATSPRSTRGGTEVGVRAVAPIACGTNANS